VEEIIPKKFQNNIINYLVNSTNNKIFFVRLCYQLFLHIREKQKSIRGLIQTALSEYESICESPLVLRIF
jgi:hypothetical protein